LNLLAIKPTPFISFYDKRSTHRNITLIYNHR